MGPQAAAVFSSHLTFEAGARDCCAIEALLFSSSLRDDAQFASISLCLGRASEPVNILNRAERRGEKQCVRAMLSVPFFLSCRFALAGARLINLTRPSKSYLPNKFAVVYTVTPSPSLPSGGARASERRARYLRRFLHTFSIHQLHTADYHSLTARTLRRGLFAGIVRNFLRLSFFSFHFVRRALVAAMLRTIANSNYLFNVRADQTMCNLLRGNLRLSFAGICGEPHCNILRFSIHI